MRGFLRQTGFSALLALAASVAAQAAPPAAAVAERDPSGLLTVSWSSPDPVDVLVADKAGVPAAQYQVAASGNREGKQLLASAAAPRSYILLRDARTGETTRVAERLIPLEAGSNFRDIGGYQGAGGKHVRWGLIYRSGATPLLTPADQARIGALGLTQMVDLRSDEERVLAPTRIDGVPYTAVGYSMKDMMRFMSATGGNGSTLYRQFPRFLAPQLRIIFAHLKRGDGPLVYNCSAGQDRTGFTTAVILSALGVSRETILEDYHLSTRWRRPANEMPPINAAAYPPDSFYAMFARFQDPNRKPEVLRDPDGTPFLAGAFAEIDAKYGSIEGYLAKEIGFGAKDVAALRKAYLE